MREVDETGKAGGVASGLHLPKWIFGAVLLALSAALTWWPQGLETWRYDRDAIAAGEYWRLVTGHLVHVGATHFALNLLGVLLVTDLLWNELQARHGFALVIMSVIVIDIGLWYRYPGLDWYAGLSGLLHGLWAGCALTGLRPAVRSGPCNGIFVPEKFLPHLINSMALVLLCGKLWIEYQTGPVSEAVALIGAPAVYAAHWYGAMAGAGYALLLLCLTGWKQRIRARKDFGANFD